MPTTSMSTLLSPLYFSSLTHKPHTFLKTQYPSLSILHNKALHLQNPPQVALKPTNIWRISAVSEDSLPTEVNTIESTEIVANGDGGVSNVISILLFIAFVGLSVLTIGVIYIAVTDFLQKREKEKFEKEEVSNKKKKNGNKVRARARARDGPRGFGQKVEEGNED